MTTITAPAPTLPANTTRGEAALQKVMARLVALPADRLRILNADASIAATCIMGVVKLLAEPRVMQRFENLARSGEWSLESVKVLDDLAWALWFTDYKLNITSVTETEALLPESLASHSAELKSRLFRLCDYHLGDHPVAGRIVASTKSGTGYRDTAFDLAVFAELLRTYLAILSTDTKNFRPTDAEDAQHTSEQILGLLGKTPALDDGKWTDLRLRAWTLLCDEYQEVLEAAQFLYRREKGEEKFLPLMVMVREATQSRGTPSAPTDPGKPSP